MPQPSDPSPLPVELPAADLAGVKELYLQGRYRAAYEAGAGFGPLRNWGGPAGRLIAGRLAMQLGAPILGRRLHAVAYRESPAYPEAVYYHARFRLDRFGPLACWRFTRHHTDWSEAAPEIRADWAALLAFLASRFRDFDQAEKHLAQSEALCPNRPWHFVERASVLEAQDDLDAALASARRSLELQSWFRPGVQAVAHLLTRQGREEEAVEFLTEAVDRMESGMVVAQLAALQIELHRYADAVRNLDRFVELSPLMEPDVAVWLAARRADATYLLGDFPAAAAHAKLVGEDDEFYSGFAVRLLAPPPGDPHRLVLPFERSPNDDPPTAGEMLGRFWNESIPPAPAEAEPLADGIPDADERKRLEAAGWVCREFTLTFDAAVELIRRGLPFVATLFEAGFGQHRLILGFDALRESLFLAEPADRRPVEAPMATVLERFAATGPRCLVAVPAAAADRLAGLTLPDADLHDRFHQIRCLAADGKFTDAKHELDRLTAEHPGHRVTKLAAVAWARATAHPVLALDAVSAVLADHPHNATFALVKANAFRELGRVHERMVFLREQGGHADADPLLMQSFAQVLLPRPHDQHEADRLLRRSIRLRPHAPAGYFLLAAQRWEQQAFAESLAMHRMACCLDEREEQFGEAYLRVARASGQLPDAVRLFQRRVTGADRPSPAAVRMLYVALVERGEPDFARTALEKAIDTLVGSDNRDRDSDGQALGELRLFRAELLAHKRRFDDAEADLTAARPLVPPAAWLKSAARIARARPAYRAALGHLRELLALDPLNADGQRLCVGLIADTEGKAAARAYLNELCQRFPHYYPALRMRAEFLTGEPDDAAVRAAQDLVELCPHDAWAHRQLALVYSDRRRADEALAAIRRAGESESDHPSHFAVLANVLRRADRTDEALAAFRDGLSGFVDHELAIAELVRTARGRKEKRAALKFVCDQLHVQPTNGEGLTAYRDQAVQLIEDPEDQEALQAELDRFLDERPDLWQAWSLMIQQLLFAHRAEEAYTLAKQATGRFPLLARLWVDLAEAARQTNRTDERIEALHRAVLAAAGWTPAAKELADALAEQDEFGAAVEVLERNLERADTDPLAYGFLADQLWNSDRGEDAMRHAEAAVRHEPGYDWAWGAVANWGDRLDRPNAVVELARSLAEDRGGDARVFMKLARTLYQQDQTDEALAALDRAIALDPTSPEAHDLKAERLADAGRFDEALAAVKPPHLLDDLPLILRGREAWVEARRGNFSAAIPMMQALVSVDPQYYWGWSQLAEWYNDIDKPEAYLEAAEEMIRLRPNHPTPLAMRGEAKLQTGDREGGKADLREALRLHPGHSPAAAILFDACLADGELRDARAALSVLQEHLTGPEVVVKQLVYATRTKDESAAARAFAEVCAAAGEDSPGALQAALNEMRAAGYEDRAAELMADAWKSGEPFSPWIGLFWLDTPAGEAADPEERLAACDAILRHHPTFIPAYDRKAEQLARLERYDEARSACTPIGLTPPPLTLRGRAAWVESARGDTAKAIELMTACLDEDPDYTWGWRQLAHWYDDLGRPADCLTAAEQLVRLAPHDPYAFGIRGEAKRMLGDHRGARDDYQRAFDLDPNFDAAGRQLISEQLSVDDLAGATRTLAALRANSHGPELLLRAVQLAARQQNLSQSRDALRTLASDQTVRRSTLRDAAKALDEAGWTAEADEELSAALEADDCTPAAAAVWAERHFATGNGWKVRDRLTELAARNASAGREAVLVYAWAMAVTGQPEAATATVQRFADLIRQTDNGWGRAGAVLAEAKKYALVTAWLGDWETREGCEPWMLRALADAYRVRGDDANAHGVLIAAATLARATEEPLPDDLRAWLALDAALAGNAEAAREHLGQIDSLGRTDAVNLLLVLARSLVAVRTSANPRAAFTEARADIQSAAGACPPDELPCGIGRVYRRFVGQLARISGGVTARCWALGQRFRPWVREKPASV